MYCGEIMNTIYTVCTDHENARAGPIYFSGPFITKYQNRIKAHTKEGFLLAQLLYKYISISQNIKEEGHADHIAFFRSSI